MTAKKEAQILIKEATVKGYPETTLHNLDKTFRPASPEVRKAMRENPDYKRIVNEARDVLIANCFKRKPIYQTQQGNNAMHLNPSSRPIL